jgi:hypothetical protein
MSGRYAVETNPRLNPWDIFDPVVDNFEDSLNSSTYFVGL